MVLNYDAGEWDVAVIGAGARRDRSCAGQRPAGMPDSRVYHQYGRSRQLPLPTLRLAVQRKAIWCGRIDALGGEMGRTADAATIQSRMLNLGKGPAVHSLRAQIDRREYSKIMKHTLEQQPGLQLKQAEILDLYPSEEGKWKVITRMQAEYTAKAVILATGTFLGGRIYVGEVSYDSGPDGLFPSSFLSEPLRKLGLRLRRF